MLERLTERAGDKRFLNLFAWHARTIVTAAEALRFLLDGGEAMPRHIQTIIAQEQEADGVTREVLIAARRIYISRFQRGDVTRLITAMDDVIDEIQKTAKTVDLFGIRDFEPEMRTIADAIVNSSELIQEAVSLIGSVKRNAGELGDIAQQISSIEETTETYDVGVRKAYVASALTDEVMAFIAKSKIYSSLENVVERFDDVANEIYGIVVEQT